MKKLLSYREDGQEYLALIEDDRLVRFEKKTESSKTKSVIGTILLGRIEKVLIPLQAAYVDIGLEESAFLPLDGKNLSDFPAGLEMPVQIQKERDSYKKTAVTDNLTLQGQYVVLTSSNRRIGISKKLADPDTRERLADLAKRFPLYGKTGYILRTECAEADPGKILAEAEYLSDQYLELVRKTPFASVGNVLFEKDSFFTDFILDEGISTFDEILFDDKKRMNDALDELRIRRLNLDESRIRLFQDPRWDLDEVYHVQHQLTEAMVPQVFLQNQGYLFIEQTQALVSIDVNSGNLSGQKNKERAVTDANLSAIPEIVRQIRLRNLSGIILIDFINMTKEENREQVLEQLRKEFRKDKRKVTVYGFTHLQLCEITREKMGRPLEV
ncbi:MAG: ribonuclease E/G [Firmicutes bacterium]|nr:ribonuclease E/G [Bacillota bacterium]